MEFAKGVKLEKGSIIILPTDGIVPKIEEYLTIGLFRLKKLRSWSKFESYVIFNDKNLYNLKSGQFANPTGFKIDVNFKSKLIVDLKSRVSVRIVKIIDFNEIKIIAISGIFITQDIKDNFVADSWVSLGRDTFTLIARSAEPRDVVRLCGANRQLRSWCTENFYADMLRHHFNDASETPKETFFRSNRVQSVGLRE